MKFGVMKVFIVICSIAVLVGCASSSGNKALETYEPNKSIVKGETTKDDILRMYGEPVSKIPAENDGQIWNYYLQKGKVNAIGYVPVANLFMKSSESEYKTLGILINKDGKVANYTYHEKKEELTGFEASRKAVGKQ